jgi:two-component system, OmpR family, phosphate regulon response regulator PhoB
MKKILIVEDQEDIREVIRITLELEDFDIHEAADGNEGLRMATQLRPDLVLSDVMMPGMDGLQMCQRIKSDPGLKRTKVILLSARGLPDDRKAGTAAGADAYMAKPYGPLDLLATVRKVIG